MQDIPQAKEYFERALAIRAEVLGEGHVHTQQVRESLRELEQST